MGEKNPRRAGSYRPAYRKEARMGRPHANQGWKYWRDKREGYQPEGEKEQFNRTRTARS